LTLPWDLARAVAFDARLSSDVFGLCAEEIARWQCARARAAGVASPRAGSILENQRFADGALCWPHAHLVAPDGVFYETDSGLVRFHGTGAPRDRDVAALVGRVTERVGRLLERRARGASQDEADQVPVPGHELTMQCAAVAPTGRLIVDGSDPQSRRRGKGGQTLRRKPLCARSPEGFELHAAVHVPASDRAGLERLCRYIARPAICDGRLARLSDGSVEVRLKRVWKGGVRSLLFEPLAFIARLAVLIPLPMAHMRRAYGVFAPAHPWRSRVVPEPRSSKKTGRPVAPKRPDRMAWSDLLARVFQIDGLRCPYCQGRMRIVGAILEPTAIQAIIAAVHLADAQAAERARAAPGAPPGPAG
jgi:hypothetical protein